MKVKSVGVKKTLNVRRRPAFAKFISGPQDEEHSRLVVSAYEIPSGNIDERIMKF
jgi:hypothetical protein